MGNLAILASIGLQLTDRLIAVLHLQAKAAAENRDVSAAELDALFADDAAARAQLQATIDARKAAGS